MNLNSYFMQKVDEPKESQEEIFLTKGIIDIVDEHGMLQIRLPLHASINENGKVIKVHEDSFIYTEITNVDELRRILAPFIVLKLANYNPASAANVNNGFIIMEAQKLNAAIQAGTLNLICTNLTDAKDNLIPKFRIQAQISEEVEEDGIPFEKKLHTAKISRPEIKQKWAWAKRLYKNWFGSTNT